MCLLIWTQSVEPTRHKRRQVRLLQSGPFYFGRTALIGVWRQKPRCQAENKIQSTIRLIVKTRSFNPLVLKLKTIWREPLPRREISEEGSYRSIN
jgi:hypothetical protein